MRLVFRILCHGLAGGWRFLEKSADLVTLPKTVFL